MSLHLPSKSNRCRLFTLARQLAVLALLLTALCPVPPPASARPSKQTTSLADLPAPAQSAISSAIARGQSDYLISATADGYRAVNPAYQLAVEFDATGARIEAGNESGWNLQLRGLGRGERMRPLMLVPLFLMAVGGTLAFAARLEAAGPSCTVGPGGETYSHIQEAVNDPGCAMIDISPGTYYESVTINRNLSIRGAGQSATIVDAALTDLVFKIGISGTGPRPSSVSISDLTIQNGKGDIVLSAGGLYANADSFSLTRVRFANNDPGALGAWSPVTVTESTFYNNSSIGGGGAINSGQALTVTNSYFSTNSSNGCGGAITSRGSLLITGSTFYNNSTSPGDGGAICVTSDNVVPPTVTIVNSTFSGNHAASNGGPNPPHGGAILANLAALTIINSTIASNTVVGTNGSGGGIYLAGGTATLKNTIVSGNSAPFGGNCDGDAPLAIDGGHNLDSGATCGFSSGNGSLSNAAANLGTLDKYGGWTPTMKLLTGSAAIDAGDRSTCASAPVNNFDQRGYLRITGPDPACDIGAFELGSPGPPHYGYLPLVIR